MSRAYNMTVEIKSKKIRMKELGHIMMKKFGWTDTTDWQHPKDDTCGFAGEGTLYGGQSEEEAHKQIYNHLKRRDPKSKIKTTWTYMEDLPYETYGDDIED